MYVLHCKNSTKPLLPWESKIERIIRKKIVSMINIRGLDDLHAGLLLSRLGIW